MPRIINNETKSLIHLNLMQDVGSKTVQLLIEIFNTAENALKAAPEDIKKEFRKKGKGKEAPPGLIHKIVHNSLEEELELISKHDCHIVTLFDEEYPSLLKNISTPPPVLYVKGKLDPQDQNSICIIGTRKASDYGQQVSHKLSYELAKMNVTVVSGLAEGVDSYAHRGALDAGGRTIAVIGRGLSDIFPSKNRKLAEKIVQSGALISRFPMGNRNERKNMHERNRIMSGLAHQTVVVEAPKHSGALSTAKEALIQKRKVFAVPGEILTKNSAGCHQLIKNGAELLDSVEDLFKELPQYIAETTPSKQPIFSESSGSVQLPLPIIEEKHEGDELPLEPVVENAVVDYFENKFPGFSIKLQFEIWKPDYTGRADVVLVDKMANPLVIVECKRVGYVGKRNVEQLPLYLTNTKARFGVFANSKEPDLWNFYRKVGQDGLNKITRSEFEKEILDDTNTKKLL